MQRHVRTERPAGSQGRAHFNRFPEHGGEKGVWPLGHALVPESGFDVFAGKPDQAVALADEMRKVLDLLRRNFGNVCENKNVNFIQFLGRKRIRIDDYVVLVLDSVAAGEKGGNQKAARISVGPIHAKNGYAFADDGNHVAPVVRRRWSSVISA